MKNLSYLLLFLAGTLALTSCGKDDPAPIEVGSVELNETTLTLAIGDVYNLKATVLPDNAENKTVVWRSSDKNVVDVSDAGRVTALAAGTATVTATASGKSATCTVTVLPIEVESVTLDRTELALIRGGSETLTATVLPADAADKTVAWRSSDNAIAAVDDTGRVEALAVGTATVTATAGGKSAACTVTVLPIEVESIQLDQSQLTFKRGEKQSLKVTVQPADADAATVTWQSTAPNVATVSEEGLVTAVDLGTATVTATVNGKSASCTVEVEPDIYVVGYTGVAELDRKGVLWKNGVASELPCSEANAVFVSEGDVYIAGLVRAKDAPLRTVWFKNNTQMESFEDDYSHHLFVRGKDVYMACGDNGIKTWKNGTTKYATMSADASLNSLFVDENNNVYVAGDVDLGQSPTGIQRRSLICYWKNSELHSLYNSPYGGTVYSILVKDDVVYAGGSIGTFDGSREGTIWTADTSTKIDDCSTITGLCVTENKDVYALGFTQTIMSPGRIWKNGVLTDKQPLNHFSPLVSEIFVFGEEVYFAGNSESESKPVVWKNGEEIVLPGENCTVRSLFVY